MSGMIYITIYSTDASGTVATTPKKKWIAWMSGRKTHETPSFRETPLTCPINGMPHLIRCQNLEGFQAIFEY